MRSLSDCLIRLADITAAVPVVAVIIKILMTRGNESWTVYKDTGKKLVMDARSAMRPCYILPMFFIFFFMAALVGQTAERIFTKLSHVVDIRCYLRTY